LEVHQAKAVVSAGDHGEFVVPLMWREEEHAIIKVGFSKEMAIERKTRHDHYLRMNRPSSAAAVRHPIYSPQSRAGSMTERPHTARPEREKPPSGNSSSQNAASANSTELVARKAGHGAGMDSGVSDWLRIAEMGKQARRPPPRYSPTYSQEGESQGRELSPTPPLSPYIKRPNTSPREGNSLKVKRTQGAVAEEEEESTEAVAMYRRASKELDKEDLENAMPSFSLHTPGSETGSQPPLLAPMTPPMPPKGSPGGKRSVRRALSGTSISVVMPTSPQSERPKTISRLPSSPSLEELLAIPSIQTKHRATTVTAQPFA